MLPILGAIMKAMQLINGTRISPRQQRFRNTPFSPQSRRLFARGLRFVLTFHNIRL